MSDYHQCAWCGAKVNNTYLCTSCKKGRSEWSKALLDRSELGAVLIAEERQYRYAIQKERRLGINPEAVAVAKTNADFLKQRGKQLGLTAIFGSDRIDYEDLFNVWWLDELEHEAHVQRVRERVQALVTAGDALSASEQSALALYMSSFLDDKGGRKPPSDEMAVALSEIEGKQLSAATFRKRIQRIKARLREIMSQN